MSEAFDAEPPPLSLARAFDEASPPFKEPGVNPIPREITNMNAVDKLAEALAKAQGEMENAALNKTNPHFKSRYADLAAIRDATVPSLSKHGLALVQTEEWRDGSPWLVTRLMHTSGQMIMSEHPLPSDVNRPQIFGSAMTYARRYCWAAICGIAAEEDDDAEGTKTAAPVRLAKPPVRVPVEPPPSETPDPGPLPPFLDRNKPGLHDQETGEILEPGLLAVPRALVEGKDVPDWKTWGLNFLNAVKGCSTLQETWAWTDHNATPLEQMKKQAPAVYERLRVAVENVRKGMVPKDDGE